MEKKGEVCLVGILKEIENEELIVCGECRYYLGNGVCGLASEIEGRKIRLLKVKDEKDELEMILLMKEIKAKIERLRKKISKVKLEGKRLE